MGSMASTDKSMHKGAGMNIRPLESLTKEELIDLIRHERMGGIVERPDEYAYFSDWYAKDAPDEIGVSALHMARHAWLEGIRFADLFPAAPQPTEPSRSDPDTEREKWLSSLFPEDRMFEEIDQMARESYKRHMSLKRGQMVVRADSMDSHIVWATKRWIEKNEPVKVPSDDDSLTIAYMSGYHDGKRSMTPEGWQLAPKELIDFLEAKEHHLPVEDQHALSIMLSTTPKFGEEE